MLSPWLQLYQHPFNHTHSLRSAPSVVFASTSGLEAWTHCLYPQSRAWSPCPYPTAGPGHPASTPQQDLDTLPLPHHRAWGLPASTPPQGLDTLPLPHHRAWDTLPLPHHRAWDTLPLPHHRAWDNPASTPPQGLDTLPLPHHRAWTPCGVERECTQVWPGQSGPVSTRGGRKY